MLDALPLSLHLAGPDAGRVTAWVEGVLGWQPVSAGAGGLSPQLGLCDVAGAPEAGGGPTVLLVAAADDPVEVAATVRSLRPGAVVAWPGDRDALPAQVEALLARPRTETPAVATLRVAGAAGGVGVTTVALALGALSAWQRGATLVTTHGAVPLAVPRTVDVDTLAGPRTYPSAFAVPGIAGLRVVRCTAPAPEAGIDAGPAVAVVRDVGVADDADVLVLRHDAAGVGALERSAAAVAVVVDDGVAPRQAVAGAAAGRRTILLPRSARVARAGYLRRVPTALPASYLRALRPIAWPERGAAP